MRAARIVALAVATALASTAGAEDAPAPVEESAPAPPAAPDRWRVSVSTGWGGIIELADVYGSLLIGTAQQGQYQLGVRVDHDAGRGSLGVGYTLQHWRDVTQTDFSDNTVHLVIADARVRWLQTTWVDMYVGGGIGLAAWSQTGNAASPLDGPGASFAFQLRLLGIDGGGEHFRVWGELGFGFEGLLLAGVSWRF